jgi:uncharacterized protein YqfA (UPF0365 family)
MDGAILGLFVLVGAIIFLSIFFNFVPMGLWISAVSAGTKVKIGSLVGMKLRRVKPAKVVLPLIKATKAGLKISTAQLEAHLLSGGRVDRLVDALIAAQKAKIALDFDVAQAIDLAGRDVLEAVQMTVNPKVIETPKISGVALNGVEVYAKVRITVRTNIERLVGGAGEDTIVARVGEGIVSSIGSSETHEKVLKEPDYISRKVLEKGLDVGTAYEILSIDIADVDIGRNIGATLKTEQAEADKKIAQAKAEERRATALAQIEENKAAVVLAETEIPMAMAQALREGHLGVMDYLNIKNKEANTRMQDSLARNGIGAFGFPHMQQQTHTPPRTPAPPPNGQSGM